MTYRALIPTPLGWLLILGCAWSFGEAIAADFEAQLYREIALRSVGVLQVSNLRGAVEVQPWSQDRIRVVATKRVRAESASEAERELSIADVRLEQQEQGLEVRAEYGQQLELAERLKERKNPRVSMDLLIQAPPYLQLKVLTGPGRASLREWKGQAEIRTSVGRLRVEHFRGSSLAVACESCRMLSDVRAEVRVLAVSGRVEMKRIAGAKLFVDIQRGDVVSEDVRSEHQVYLLRDAKMVATRAVGEIEFSALSGSVALGRCEGSVSGKTVSGSIRLDLKRWGTRDRSFLESESGDVELSLASEASGEIEIVPGSGAKVETDFDRLLRKSETGRAQLKLGSTRRQMRVSSQKGLIRLLRTQL
jgi:DUF4097 and DUF4098 domain-containing protein YvlB